MGNRYVYTTLHYGLGGSVAEVGRREDSMEEGEREERYWPRR